MIEEGRRKRPMLPRNERKNCVTHVSIKNIKTRVR